MCINTLAIFSFRVILCSMSTSIIYTFIYRSCTIFNDVIKMFLMGVELDMRICVSFKTFFVQRKLTLSCEYSILEWKVLRMFHFISNNKRIYRKKLSVNFRQFICVPYSFSALFSLHALKQGVEFSRRFNNVKSKL